MKRSNSILAMVAVIGLTILGIYFAFSIPSSVFPEMTFNRAIIMADAGDLPPEQMIVAVTRAARRDRLRSHRSFAGALDHHAWQFRGRRDFFGKR